MKGGAKFLTEEKEGAYFSTMIAPPFRIYKGGKEMEDLSEELSYILTAHRNTKDEPCMVAYYDDLNDAKDFGETILRRSDVMMIRIYSSHPEYLFEMKAGGRGRKRKEEVRELSLGS